MKEEFFEGNLVGNSKGFGFVSIEGFDDDFFIPPNKMGGALDGDRVVICATNVGENSNLAEVRKILEYANQQIVGDLAYGLMGNYVVSDNHKLHKVALITPKDLHGANVGDKVVVKITAQPAGDENLRGEITEVLGQATDRSVLEKAIIRAIKLPETFPQNVLDAAFNVPQEVSPKEKQERADLTEEIIFTIDGDDSKDLDDAVSITKLPNGNYFLGVHIADVGNYVKRGSDIDAEAYKRGTSAYFPGYVIPMLPTALSNGICSLNEGVERLALSCEMEITPNAEVVKHRIFESVIKSVARLTYNRVYATLKGEETSIKYLQLAEKFKAMEELCLILEKNKNEKGYLELDLPETYFELNEKGELLNIHKYEHNIAHRIIESFMIVCNETVAQHFYERKIPFVYRVHETPPPEKVANLTGFIEGLGLNPIVFSKNITSKDYQNVLTAAEGKPYEDVLHKVVLISLAKARYFQQCLGHFGLASTYYTHFTSPIRRYSDLTIHRIIKDYLNHKINKDLSTEEIDELKEFVAESSEQASVTEKRAENTERQVNALKMAEFMQKHIGEVFEGNVCGVTSFGIFVELENTVEGLVRIENLPDDEYEYQEKTMTLKGRTHSFGFGAPIKVRVVAVDLPKRQIDFCEADTAFVPRMQREKITPRERREGFSDSLGFGRGKFGDKGFKTDEKKGNKNKATNFKRDNSNFDSKKNYTSKKKINSSSDSSLNSGKSDGRRKPSSERKISASDNDKGRGFSDKRYDKPKRNTDERFSGEKSFSDKKYDKPKHNADERFSGEKSFSTGRSDGRRKPSSERKISASDSDKGRSFSEGRSDSAKDTSGERKSGVRDFNASRGDRVSRSSKTERFSGVRSYSTGKSDGRRKSSSEKNFNTSGSDKGRSFSDKKYEKPKRNTGDEHARGGRDSNAGRSDGHRSFSEGRSDSAKDTSGKRKSGVRDFSASRGDRVRRSSKSESFSGVRSFSTGRSDGRRKLSSEKKFNTNNVRGKPSSDSNFNGSGSDKGRGFSDKRYDKPKRNLSVGDEHARGSRDSNAGKSGRLKNSVDERTGGAQKESFNSRKSGGFNGVFSKGGKNLNKTKKHGSEKSINTQKNFKSK